MCNCETTISTEVNGNSYQTQKRIAFSVLTKSVQSCSLEHFLYQGARGGRQSIEEFMFDWLLNFLVHIKLYPLLYRRYNEMYRTKKIFSILVHSILKITFYIFTHRKAEIINRTC